MIAWNYDDYLVVQGAGAPKRYEVRARLEAVHTRREQIRGCLVFPRGVTLEQVDRTSRRLVRFMVYRLRRAITYICRDTLSAIQRANDAQDWALRERLIRGSNCYSPVYGMHPIAMSEARRRRAIREASWLTERGLKPCTEICT